MDRRSFGEAEMAAVTEAVRRHRSNGGNGGLRDLYLNEMAHVPLLEAEEELEQCMIYRRGEEARERLNGEASLEDDEWRRLQAEVELGDRAKELLATANSRLVMSIARSNLASGVPLMDLVQEGNIGLIQAIGRFRPELGCRLSTYATWWIRHCVGRAAATQGRNISLPFGKLQDIGRLKRKTAKMEQHLGRKPTAEELAGALGMDRDRVDQLVKWSMPNVSLDSPQSVGRRAGAHSGRVRGG
jgi:DNA-directed RNA polymerase sigma subunit (sigma70/sigma32)